MIFKNREQAAQQLINKLIQYKNQEIVVYALPRGGVILGKIIAKALESPLDLLIPRKIGHPLNPEYAIAAVTETGEVVKNFAEITALDQKWFQDTVAHEREEAARRRKHYLAERDYPKIKDKIAIIVDDGIATGLTMKAAVLELKKRLPSQIIVAVPVASRDAVQTLENMEIKVITIESPENFRGAIGAHYEEFKQISDQEVISLMK